MPASRQTSRFFASESTPENSPTPRRATRSRTATASSDVKPLSTPQTTATAVAAADISSISRAQIRGQRTSQVKGKVAVKNEKQEDALADVEDFGRRVSKRQRVAASNARAAFVADSEQEDGASDSDAAHESSSSSLSEDDYDSEESLPRRRATATAKATGSTKRKASAGKSSSSSTPRKGAVRKPARSVIDAASGAKMTTPPSDWEQLYELVLQMRRPGGIAANAAVDTMGCERLADRMASPRDQRFHTLIALMLSSQTKDTVNAVVMKRLQTELPGYEPGAPAGLNLENVLAVDAEVLNQMIWAVGFHNNKTKYIKQAAEILRDKWNGDIPDSIVGLTSLPGVGPKMAHLCLSHAWNRTEGIGVDVHVHRLTNMWGWHKTSSPEETRLALQAWLPHDKWAEINWLLVGFGQTVCPSSGKNCGACEVGLQGLCRAADKKKIADGRKWLVLRKMKEEEEGVKHEDKVKRDVDSVNMELKKEDMALEAAATAADKSTAKSEHMDDPVKIKDEQD